MSIVATLHPAESTLPPVVSITVVTLVDIKRMKRTVDRAINCDPEAGADLFALADNLETYIQLIEKGVLR